MVLNLLVVLTKNYAIRYDSKTPWTNSQYLEYFKDLTKDGIIVMGRKTFEELPLTLRPMQDRMNVVLSNEFSKYKELTKNELIFTNIYFLENKIIPENPDRDVWVIGGKQVYEAFSNRCQYIYIVLLEKSVKKPFVSFVDILPYFQLTDFSKEYFSEDENCNFMQRRAGQGGHAVVSPCRMRLPTSMCCGETKRLRIKSWRRLAPV